MPSLSDLFYQIVPFLTIITVLITVHEFGHYLAARYYGVAIHTFSIGFGKVIWKHMDKKGVTWQICMLPLGGFVRMASLDLLEAKRDMGEISPERFNQLKPQTMEGQSVLGRIIIAAAGPFANILLAIFTMTTLSMYGGEAVKVECVVPGSPADQAGLQKGDILSQEGGDSLKWGEVKGNPNGFAAILHKNGETKKISFIKQKVDFTACDGKVENNQIYAGITRSITISKELRSSFFDSFGKSLYNTQHYFMASFSALASLLVPNKQKTENQASVGGIISIQQAAANISKVSLWYSLYFSASLSLSLAFFNLLPIPILDGGHILLAIIEGVARKRLSKRIRMLVTFIGLAFMLILFIFLVNVDLMRILTK